MPKHGPQPSRTRIRQAARGRRIAEGWVNPSDWDAIEPQVMDLVHHHEYVKQARGIEGKGGRVKIVHDIESQFVPEEDRPDEGALLRMMSERPLGAGLRPQRRHVLANDWSRLATRSSSIGGPRMSRQDVFAEQSLGHEKTGMYAITSGEIRHRAGNGFTGERNEGAQDRLAANMRHALAVQQEVLHAPFVSGSATRDGRPEFRTLNSQRSTVKLGDGKRGI